MPFLPLDSLRNGALEIGIELSDEQLGQYDEFAAFLVETNTRFNLTRITEPQAITANHYLDSLLCLRAAEFGKGSRVIDIGSGAGFPGIPLKIARPDLAVTLVDSTFKKVRFMEQTIERLGLSNIEPVHARAEDLGAENAMREAFDIACCRALAELRIAAELCLPFVAVGGRMIALKGADSGREIEDAENMIGRLGGRVEKTARASIPGTDIVRGYVVVQKTKKTPSGYPRPYAQIARTSGRPAAERKSGSEAH